MATFDRIATLPRQGRISEIELRLYLAGQGASSMEVSKVRVHASLTAAVKGQGAEHLTCSTSSHWLAHKSHPFRLTYPFALALTLFCHAQVVKLFRTLVKTDRYDFVTFWDFVTSYDWISQAFRIYNVPA